MKRKLTKPDGWSYPATMTGTIEGDTGIMLDVVSDAVIQQASHVLDIDLRTTQPNLMGWMTGYAAAVYANNPKFRKKIQSNANQCIYDHLGDGGNAGRDWLYSFMQHWLSAEILRRCGKGEKSKIRNVLVSSGFSTGRYQG